MFILLGLLVFPGQLLEIFWQGIALSIILMFVARPIAVFLSLVFMKYNLKEQVFVSWAGLKGAVPIVLATYPIIAGIESSQLIFNAVFFVVLISALVQGSSLSWLAEKLNLTGKEKEDLLPSLEIINLGTTDSEIIEVAITEKSPAVDTSLIDLILPDNTLIIGIIREGELITPTGNSVIHMNDTLYVLSHKKSREKAKAVLIGKKKEKKPKVTEA
jgi:potassium/hydrogen antiporter